MTRVFESNGPDIKIRGTASHVAEKYVQLARDARSSGDPVAAENYYQHAEHYFRLIAAAQEQFRQNQPQPRTENEMPSEDGDDESESFSNFGQEPGFVPAQPQPFVPRDNNQRDHQREGQPYQPRDQHPAARTQHQSRASSAAAVSAAATTAAGDLRQRQRRSPALVHHRTAAADQWRPGRFRRQWRRALPAAPPPPPACGPRPEGMAARQRRATISIRGMSKSHDSGSRPGLVRNCARGAGIHTSRPFVKAP